MKFFKNSFIAKFLKREPHGTQRSPLIESIDSLPVPTYFNGSSALRQSSCTESHPMSRIAAMNIGGGKVRVMPEEIIWQFVRSSGPGGQHVNRSSTKAILRFDVRRAQGITEAVRERLLELEKSKITRAGHLLIASQKYREQPTNVAACVEKFRKILERAVEVPKVRKKKRVSKACIAKRLDGKKKRSKIKKLRMAPSD